MSTTEPMRAIQLIKTMSKIAMIKPTTIKRPALQVSQPPGGRRGQETISRRHSHTATSNENGSTNISPIITRDLIGTANRDIQYAGRRR
jgi:hypothetical protein